MRPAFLAVQTCIWHRNWTGHAIWHHDKRQAFVTHIGPVLQRPAKQTADALDDALLTQMPQKE